jgi:hypothetical protein
MLNHGGLSGLPSKLWRDRGLNVYLSASFRPLIFRLFKVKTNCMRTGNEVLSLQQTLFDGIVQQDPI